MKRYLLAFVLGGIVLSAGIAYATVSQTITLPTVGQLLYSASGNTGGVATSSTGTASTILALDANGHTAATSATTTSLSVNGDTVTGKRYLTFSYATTTAWTGTSTLPVAVIPIAMTVQAMECATNAGTLNVNFYYGPTPTHVTMYPASTTPGVYTYSSAMATAATTTVDIGTPASLPTSIQCTMTLKQT